jgi:hypothetical protein
MRSTRNPRPSYTPAAVGELWTDSDETTASTIVTSLQAVSHSLTPAMPGRHRKTERPVFARAAVIVAILSSYAARPCDRGTQPPLLCGDRCREKLTAYGCCVEAIALMVPAGSGTRHLGTRDRRKT